VGIKGCFWGVFFVLFWVNVKKTLWVIFYMVTLHMLCGIYLVYVFVEWKSVIVIGVGNYDRQ